MPSTGKHVFEVYNATDELVICTSEKILSRLKIANSRLCVNIKYETSLIIILCFQEEKFAQGEVSMISIMRYAV